MFRQPPFASLRMAANWLDEMEVGNELGRHCLANIPECPRCVESTLCPQTPVFGGTTYMAAFSTPTIDGDLGDWFDLSSDTLNQETVSNDVSGDGGREHDIRFAWDANNFYVAVEETAVDATPTEGADAEHWFALKPWSTDSVGFYDAPGIFPGPGPVTQYWVGMASDGDADRHMARLVPEDASGDFLIFGQQGVSVDGGRRISEFSMSWADIKFPGFIVEAGARFRHDPLMVDGIMEDGVYHGQNFTDGGDSVLEITSKTMSVVELSPCVASEVGTEVTCNDGIDNDCDGDIDTLDSDCPEVGARFLRADTNGDGNVNLPDAQHLLNFLFLGGPVSKCKVSTDANGDGNTNLPDAQYILNFLFLGGPDPKPPFPECAPFVETTMPEIGCETEPVGGACAP